VACTANHAPTVTTNGDASMTSTMPKFTPDLSRTLMMTLAIRAPQKQAVRATATIHGNHAFVPSSPR